jgi:hypothetical protein
MKFTKLEETMRLIKTIYKTLLIQPVAKKETDTNVI